MSSQTTIDRATACDLSINPWKQDFPLLMERSEVAYLDSAATSQRPRRTIEAWDHFNERINANPLRGLYSLSVEATAVIENARERIARLLGAVDEKGRGRASEIVFVRNATEALNLAARSLGEAVLKPGDEVAITVMEHHSNLIPWQQACKQAGAKLVVLYPNQEGEISPEEIATKIGERTRIVACAEISNVMGCRLPVEELGRAVHAHGGYLVVDGAQSVPHLQPNVEAMGADLFAFSAHKAMGPTGVGVLWGLKDVLNRMEPVLTGGEMIDSVTEQDATWAPVPERFEAGTQDAAGIAATAEGLAYLTDEVGYKLAAAREQALVAYAWERMSALDWIDCIGPTDPTKRHGVLAFNVRGVHPHDVASILDMSGVCIRAGHHCAQPLLTWLGVENLACCRASFAFYNDASEIDRLIEALEQVRRVFHGC